MNPRVIGTDERTSCTTSVYFENRRRAKGLLYTGWCSTFSVQCILELGPRLISSSFVSVAVEEQRPG